MGLLLMRASMSCETCSNCQKWVRERRRHYSDGTEQSYYLAPEGKGHCEVLGLDTAVDFGCNKFMESWWDHVHVEHIDCAPWERWAHVPCPDCNGIGSANDRACQRCSGTAKVRRYDDGYVADATWDHPLEKERKKVLSVHDDSLYGTTLAPIGNGKEGVLAL